MPVNSFFTLRHPYIKHMRVIPFSSGIFRLFRKYRRKTR